MSLSTTQYGYIIDPMVPFTDDKGKTIKNGFIRVFMAGTSTPVLTYRNYDGATNQEKIELDNSGRVKHNVIGSKGSLYKVVVYDAHHSQETPILTVDKIAVLGSSINATGATIVTGLDSVTVPEENFLKATVEGTGVELALDPTEVTSDVNTISAAETAAPDYVLPLLDKTGTGDGKKISLANLFKFALDWISRLATTVTSFASGDFIAVSNTTNGARKMSKDTLLDLTAQNALAGNVAQAFDPTRTSENPYKAGESVAYEGKAYTFKVDHYGAWNDDDVEIKKNLSPVIFRVNEGIALEQGTYSIQNGDKVFSQKRLRFNEPLIPPFNVVTKSGYKILSVFVLNNAFCSLNTIVLRDSSYSVSTNDGNLYCPIFTKNDETEDILPTDDVIDTFEYNGLGKFVGRSEGVIERLNGGVLLEQGTFVNGLKNYSLTRVRFNVPLIAPFSVETKSGYNIRAYQKTDNYGNFISAHAVDYNKLAVKKDDGYKYLIIFSKEDQSESINADEDILLNFDYGSVGGVVDSDVNNEYDPNDISVNTRIDTTTGEESARNGWIVTGFLKVSSLKKYIAYSTDKKMIRNLVFYYDQNKNFVKSEYISVSAIALGGMINSIYIYGWSGYVRFYVDQTSSVIGYDGRYPGYADSFCFEEVAYDVSPLTINKQLGNEPAERHLVSRTETYSDFITNHFDCFSELEKIDLGQSWYFPNKEQVNFYGYEYKPSKGYKKTILLTANTHGGERESSYALAAAVYMILAKFSFDEKIKYIRDNCRLLIVPSYNPFGYNEDVAHYHDAGWTWRKYQDNSQGTNNNRCWDFGWANADNNYSGTDYVGDDAMKSENNNVYERIIKPNIGMIDAWFDLHQGTNYVNRYWIESYVSQFANPLYSDLSQWLKNLCATKRELGTYGAFATEYGGKAAMFGTNVAGIPSFTLENNSLPASQEVTFVNYTSKSVTNFCEYILNMVYAVAISKYDPNSDLSSSEYFRSRRLTCPASKMFGDMFTDSSAKIIERFDGVYARSASIFKSVVTGLGEVYVIDNGNEPTKDLVLVGGDKFDIQTVNIYATAPATDYRTTNDSSPQTLALGSKNVYALLRFAEMVADNSNSDKFIQKILNKYRIHIIPLINKSAFDNKTSDSVLETNAQALVDYCQNLSDVRVIYFNEVGVANNVFSVKTTSTDALTGLVLQIKADACMLVEKDNAVIADVDAINPGNTFGINFKSNIISSGVDYSTDQVSLLVGAVVNISCID